MKRFVFILITCLMLINLSAQTADENFRKAAEAFNSKNYEEAFSCSEMAANQGLAMAQFLLSELYYSGKGVEKDLKKAFYWLEKAANQGLANSQHRLAKCYYDGAGVAKSMEKAKYWAEKAANNGFENAKDLLEKINREQSNSK